MSETIQVRVYYEDTDLAGIVYYANYLKYIERGRTEFLRARGIDQLKLRDETGMVFVVRKLAADYVLPGKMDDLLTVETQIQSASGARIVMVQKVHRDNETLFRAEVELAAIGPTGLPMRLPPELRAAG